MGIKGETEGGFPQTKPAFVFTYYWDGNHKLGPTTHPKNNLDYVKAEGTVRTVPGGSLPPFEAIIVDSGTWVQQDHLPSGEVVMRSEATALLRVVEPPNASVDPAVAEMETGYIRMKWNSVAKIGGFLSPCIAMDIEEITRRLQRDPPPSAVGTFSFQTGDHRYKFLEHAVYIGKCGLVASQADGVPEGRKLALQYKVNSLPA